MVIANEVCSRVNCKNEKCFNLNSEKCKKNDIPTKLEDRIKITSINRIFKDYTDAHIMNEQQGNRFIIKAENKKRILSELETIGITKAFLFPEVENEAKDIINDYKNRIYN